jgi:alpha-glucosidase (family GH31 glycosyl hydrolase)
MQFCSFPCVDPEGQARQQNLPPPRLTQPPPPNTPIFQDTSRLQKRQQDDVGVQFLHPQYAIQNGGPGTWPSSDRTAYTNLVHSDGDIMYNTHSLFGTMMSGQTRTTMLTRHPGLRPFLIVRSTFAGAGTKVGKWLGDTITHPCSDIYLPKDIFYDFNTLAPVQGQGQNVSLTNVNFTTIPVHIRSGVILPLRIESAMTTAQLRSILTISHT